MDLSRPEGLTDDEWDLVTVLAGEYGDAIRQGNTVSIDAFTRQLPNKVCIKAFRNLAEIESWMNDNNRKTQ